MKQMNEKNQVQDDEIDLFMLFQTLWDSKWLISTFVAIAVLLASGFLLRKDAVYESKLIYSADTLPPFHEAKKATTDFHKKFYSISVFEEWKKNNNGISLVFEDFSTTQVVDGFILSKNKGEQLVTLTSENKAGSFVRVKSNQLPIADEVFKYAIHINALLKDEYVVRAKEELKMIESRFKVFSADSKIVDTLLSIDRYIYSAEKGANVFAIQHPTIPKKVSDKSSLIIALSGVLGGMVGVFFILIRKAIATRKGSLESDAQNREDIKIYRNN
jgi:LPS O-antigen subunit length determinant protein (WzzB/FepE family)